MQLSMIKVIVNDAGAIVIQSIVQPASYGSMAKSISADEAWAVRRMPWGDSVMHNEGAMSPDWVTIDGHVLPLPFIVFRQGEYTIPEPPRITREELARRIREYQS